MCKPRRTPTSGWNRGLRSLGHLCRKCNLGPVPIGDYRRCSIVHSSVASPLPCHSSAREMLDLNCCACLLCLCRYRCPPSLFIYGGLRGRFLLECEFFLPFPCDSAFLNGAASQGSTGNTFNELLNFIPRAIVFLIIVAIYGRIHWFLRRKGTTTMSGSMPPALTTSPTGAVAEDSQPWEKLYLSGLSGIVAPGDSHRSGPHSISPCPLSRTTAPTPLNVDATAGMRPGVANADCAKAICDEPGFIAPVPPPVAMSFVPSDSLTVISAPNGDARPLSSCRDPYATGVGHSPYPGPLPVARRRAKQEHFEALQVLLTRKAAMLFLLFPLTVWILCSR